MFDAYLEMIGQWHDWQNDEEIYFWFVEAYLNLADICGEKYHVFLCEGVTQHAK